MFLNVIMSCDEDDKRPSGAIANMYFLVLNFVISRAKRSELISLGRTYNTPGNTRQSLKGVSQLNNGLAVVASLCRGDVPKDIIHE